MGFLTMAMVGTTLLTPSSTHACGGFFCNGGAINGPTPVVQAGERVIFERRADGKVRAYVQIRYQQAGGPPIGFCWVIPVTNVPEVGMADAATFDQLDALTSPQFRFLQSSIPSSSSGGGGCGFGASDATAFAESGGGSRAGGADPDDVPGVMVWERMRVGDYETATIGGEDPALVLEWLQGNDYDIPDQAERLIADYVDEGHIFVAFRYAPIGAGTGTLTPITLTMEAEKPCVPIRITAIASTAILDVIVMAFGPERAAPYGAYTEAMPDYAAIQPDFTLPTNTTYTEEVDRAVGRAGDHAWVVEYAGWTDEMNATDDLEAQALLRRNRYLTRFYTRFRPETMTIDPEFVFVGGDEVTNFHVIDIQPSEFTAAPGAESGVRFAAMPVAIAGAMLALLWRRRSR